MLEALDKIERGTGYTLTGPVRGREYDTQIVNVLSKSLGVVARNEQNREVVVTLLPRNGEVPMEQASDFGTDVASQAGVDIRVMAGERQHRAGGVQDVGVATLNLPNPRAPRGAPIRVKFADRPRRPPQRRRDRPHRRRLDRGRLRDRGRDDEPPSRSSERSAALRLLSVS